MRRNVTLEEISDGRLYGPTDMVKADCHGCIGCSKCCKGMGSSIILDPYDVHRLTTGLGKSLQELLAQGAIELHVVDGCILPNLAMTGPGESCTFLNAQGRCSIHAYRPGICRLFPLGRYYQEDGDFKYFLQVGECDDKTRTKIKVQKWIDTPYLKRNHTYLCAWHKLLKDVENAAGDMEDEEKAKGLNLGLLRAFYLMPYTQEEDFYEQIERRMAAYRETYLEIR
jgi:Fe-S-cluster containining protein